MQDVVAVKFRYAARDLWFDPGQTQVAYGDHAICKTARGTGIGLVTSDPREVSEEELEKITGGVELQPVLRVATERDLERADELAQRGDRALPVFRALVKDEALDMKPIGVEYLFDEVCAVCYFSADERVDFRQLVRNLSRELHCRIEMRQVGVREQAAIVGGYAHCGQELCCTRFGRRFDAVSIRMAKVQDLPLNSTKISGACGRLMCCLRYEFETYRDFKDRAPKRNALIETPLGQAKVVEYDTPKEQITLRLENGRSLRIALADMTASQAAHKKSEELGCTCRPNTVERSVLERLESPEVRMALAELDRKNGIEVEPEPLAQDTPSVHDRSSTQDTVQEKSKRKRSGSNGSSRSASNGGSRKRRRRSTTQKQQAKSQQPKSQQNQSVSSRREQTSTSTQAASTRATSTQTASGQGQSSKIKRRRRHPGDKGGKNSSVGTSSSSARRSSSGRSSSASVKQRRSRVRRHHKGETQ